MMSSQVSNISFIPLWKMMVMMLLLVSVKSDGCFENPDIFLPYSRYIQPLSMENRLYYQPATFSPEKMTVESEVNLSKYVKLEYTCLEEYEGNRMLVEVEKTNRKKEFQCFQFKSLTKNVMRLARTKQRPLRKKVDCEKEKYYTDEALLIAIDDLKPEPCPLDGGYQMLLHEGEIIPGHCLDSVLTYNPNIRFQCDRYNVIADFGRDCEPPILRKTQKLRRRHITHLSCVASWSEKGDIKSVLLNMRDQPLDFWCIHYKKINDTYDLMSIFLTLDGRCVEDAFQDEDFPKKTSLFGHLARYVPSNDPSCSDSEYLDECKDNEALCFESDGCPVNCQRCNTKPPQSPCRFMTDTRGSWRSLDSRQEMTVDVNENSFTVSKYGKYSCYGEADRSLPGKVYPVVQGNDMSSCLPFYSCAQVVSPSPGILYFNLRPSWRDEDSGRPFTCKETDDKIGYVIPVAEEQTITMINSEKLVKSSCGFEMAHQFPTLMEPCLLEVDECGGDCSNLVIKFNNITCANVTVAGFAIETEHICYGKLKFDDGLNGLLTYSEFSERYFCWIYNHDRLFISSPQDCNSERVMAVFSDPEAYVVYDPAQRLSKPLHDKSKRYNNSQQRLQCNGLVMLTILLLAFLCN